MKASRRHSPYKPDSRKAQRYKQFDPVTVISCKDAPSAS